MRYRKQVIELHEALVNYDCTSYDDIVALTGMTRGMVGQVLCYVRRPDVADVLGWTVPPVQRGTTAKVYRVVARDGEDLSMHIDTEIKYGARAALRTMASMGESTAHALRELLKGHGLTPAQSRIARRTAIAADGAAAMARDMAEALS